MNCPICKAPAEDQKTPNQENAELPNEAMVFDTDSTSDIWGLGTFYVCRSSPDHQFVVMKKGE